MPCPIATGAILKQTFVKCSGSRGRRSESNFAAAGTLTSASGSNKLLKKGARPLISPQSGGCRKTLPLKPAFHESRVCIREAFFNSLLIRSLAFGEKPFTVQLQIIRLGR